MNTAIVIPASASLRASADGGSIISWKAAALRKGNSAQIELPGLKKWMCLYRRYMFWLEPCFGTRSCEAIPRECEMLIWTANGQTHIAIPLCDGDLRASLYGDADGLRVQWTGNEHDPKNFPKQADLLYLRSGKNAHDLCQQAMADIQKLLGTFQLREDKNTPDFIEHLSWCTWDAFYQEVTAKKVKAGLKSFQKGGVQIGHMILDDGWQDCNTDEQLNNFTALEKDFPGGLKALSDSAKKDFGLHSFGVWHAFQGYWRGVSKNGDLAKRYRLIANTSNIRPWFDKKLAVHMIHIGVKKTPQNYAL